MCSIKISDSMLDELRKRIKPYLKEKRYSHVLGVEREAAALGEIYLPDCVNELRASALLHDITKKLSPEEHILLSRELNITLSDEELKAPKLLHAKTGAALAERDFPEYACQKVISGIRWHTTGYAGMDMFQSIIYLADYIEDTRTFEDCVILRRFFYEKIAKSESYAEKYKVFVMTMVKSFDMTIKCLIEECGFIDRNTVEARNLFVAELHGMEV